MTARIVGAVLIGAVSLYVGGAFTCMWQRRVVQLWAFCRLLSALEDGIGKMGLPVQSIVSSFSDTVLDKAGFLSETRRIWDADPTADALGGAFDVCLSHLSLDGEECALLSSFFASLGSEDRAREAERCRYVGSRLRAIYEEAAGSLAARCKIARTVSGAVGCAAALMLL